MNYEAVLFYKQQRSNQDVSQNSGDSASASSSATVTGNAAESDKDVDPAQKEKSDLVNIFCLFHTLQLILSLQ